MARGEGLSRPLKGDVMHFRSRVSVRAGSAVNGIGPVSRARIVERRAFSSVRQQHAHASSVHRYAPGVSAKGKKAVAVAAKYCRTGDARPREGASPEADVPATSCEMPRHHTRLREAALVGAVGGGGGSGHKPAAGACMSLCHEMLDQGSGDRSRAAYEHGKYSNSGPCGAPVKKAVDAVEGAPASPVRLVGVGRRP